MQVSSYIFQSPYSQPVQIGQPDPASVKKEDASAAPAAVKVTSKTLPQETKVRSLAGSDVSISLNTLQAGNAQSSVSAFKSLSVAAQAVKVYSQG